MEEVRCPVREATITIKVSVGGQKAGELVMQEIEIGSDVQSYGLAEYLDSGDSDLVKAGKHIGSLLAQGLLK